MKQLNECSCTKLELVGYIAYYNEKECRAHDMPPPYITGDKARADWLIRQRKLRQI